MGPEFFLPYSAAMLTQSGSCLTLPVTLQRGGKNASAPGNATFLSLQDISFSHGVSELCVCWLVVEPLLPFFLLLGCIYPASETDIFLLAGSLQVSGLKKNVWEPSLLR